MLVLAPITECSAWNIRRGLFAEQEPGDGVALRSSKILQRPGRHTERTVCVHSGPSERIFEALPPAWHRRPGAIYEWRGYRHELRRKPEADDPPYRKDMGMFVRSRRRGSSAPHSASILRRAVEDILDPRRDQAALSPDGSIGVEVSANAGPGPTASPVMKRFLGTQFSSESRRLNSSSRNGDYSPVS